MGNYFAPICFDFRAFSVHSDILVAIALHKSGGRAEKRNGKALVPSKAQPAAIQIRSGPARTSCACVAQ